eukprot:766640-Hanusia_phi.AAC.4
MSAEQISRASCNEVDWVKGVGRRQGEARRCVGGRGRERVVEGGEAEREMRIGSDWKARGATTFPAVRQAGPRRARRLGSQCRLPGSPPLALSASGNQRMMVQDMQYVQQRSYDRLSSPPCPTSPALPLSSPLPPAPPSSSAATANPRILPRSCCFSRSAS